MVFSLKGGCAIMRSTIRSLTCLIILTTFLGLEDHLNAARAGTVAFSAESTVIGIIATERPLANTLIWDTVSPFVNTVDIQDGTNWKIVPADLLTLELDTPAAKTANNNTIETCHFPFISISFHFPGCKHTLYELRQNP